MLSLLESQNPDGGWPYQRGGPSWTEPTAYALLALGAHGLAGQPIGRGLGWLRAGQLADGGWPPLPAVRQSAWATALAALLGPALLGAEAHRRAIAWIMRQTGKDTNWPIRLRQFLTGGTQGSPGWPWFPGSSAWVTPTALSMLALRKAARLTASPPMRDRLDLGASYLLQHACSDGGWNYGAARVLDVDAHSYPETTGVALLALSGRDSPVIRKAIAWAGQQLAGCQTSEGESWLRLALLAHRQPPATLRPARRPRTIPDAALALIASSAAAGRNLFVE